jgi:hypothetical protein
VLAEALRSGENEIAFVEVDGDSFPVDLRLQVEG